MHKAMFSKILIVLAVVSVFFGSSCKKKAVNYTKNYEVTDDLPLEVEKLLGFVSDPSFSKENCEKDLAELYDIVYKKPPTSYDIEKVDLQLDSLINNLFKIRINLRKRLETFIKLYPKKDLTTCVNSLRNAFRAIRFTEEYLGQRYYIKQGEKAPVPNYFEGSFPFFKRVEKYSDFSIESKTKGFKSGDIILSRGKSFLSAIIARLGAVDAQYSHMSLVYVDPETQQAYTIEAHIEIGVVAKPLDFHLKVGNHRAILLRNSSDPTLAALAAKIMYDRAISATEAGANIPYDFAMNSYDNGRELYCSEVVRLGYQLAAKQLSRDVQPIPLFMTSYKLKNKQILNGLGFKHEEGFSPGDIIFDPRFEIVTEWTDFSKATDSRYKDAVLTAMYNWMEDKNYKLYPEMATKVLGTFFWGVRKVPVLGNYLKDTFSKNMPKSTIKIKTTLVEIAGSLYDRLVKFEQDKLDLLDYVQKSQMELLLELESFRQSDYRAYQEGLNPKFHEIFHQ